MPRYYDDWKESSFTCRHCAWTGSGSELEQGELFRESFEVCCPKCGEVVTAVHFPTISESRQNWDQLSAPERSAVLRSEARQADFERRKVRGPEPLPDLADENLVIVWDIEGRAGGDTILKWGDQVLWREPAFFEGFERYLEVGDSLVAKYGSRLKDFVPTAESELYLYGDSLVAPAKVEAFRKRLRGRSSNHQA